MYIQNSNQLYHNNFKKQNKKSVRKDCNKIGFMLLFASIFMNIVSTVLVLLITFTGSYDYSGKTGISGIPYTLYYLLNAIYEFSGFFIVPIIFCLIFRFKFSDALPLNNNKRYNTLSLVIGGYAICTISNLFVNILNSNLNIFGIENRDAIELKAQSITEQIFYFICVAIVPALVEEFMFRGIILNYLRKHGDGFAILVSSLLFGLVHGNFVQIPFAFIVGLVCGVLVIKTGSIIPAMLLHLLNNGTSVLLDITSNYVSDDVYSFITSIAVFTLTLAGFIAIVLLCKKGFSLKFETKNTPTFSLSITEKCTSLMSNPGTIVVISMYVVSGLLTIMGAI